MPSAQYWRTLPSSWFTGRSGPAANQDGYLGTWPPKIYINDLMRKRHYSSVLALHEYSGSLLQRAGLSHYIWKYTNHLSVYKGKMQVTIHLIWLMMNLLLFFSKTIQHIEVFHPQHQTYPWLLPCPWSPAPRLTFEISHALDLQHQGLPLRSPMPLISSTKAYLWHLPCLWSPAPDLPLTSPMSLISSTRLTFDISHALDLQHQTYPWHLPCPWSPASD